MLKIWFAIALLFLSINAHAIKDNEFFWQAGKKEFYLKSDLIVSSVKSNYKNSASYLKQSGTLTTLKAEYGITNKISFEIGTSYRDQEFKLFPANKSEYKGLGDLDFTLRGNNGWGKSNFRYGTTFTLSLGDVEVDSKGYNNHAGANAMAPYVGIDWGKEDVTYGVLLGYKFNLEDVKRVTAGFESTIGGGEVLHVAGFTERALPKNLNVGAMLQYLITKDRKDSAEGNIEVANQIYFAVYGSNLAYEKVAFTYQLGYLAAGKTNTLDSTKGFLGALGARFSF